MTFGKFFNRIIAPCILMSVGSGAQITLAAAEAPAPFSTTMLSDNLYVVHGGSGHGAHVGLCVGKDGVLLIDSMSQKSTDRLVESIKSITKKPVTFIINTHDHADHSGGNTYFEERGATTISHANSEYGPLNTGLKIDGAFKFDFCGNQISAHPVVAHTHGDLVIKFEESNSIFMGDTFTNTYHPYAFARGRESEIGIGHLGLSLSDPQTKIVPGHGLIDSREAFDRHIHLVNEWYDKVGELRQTRKNINEMMADPTLVDLIQKFVKKRVPAELPPERYRRFLERTLSADFVEKIETTPEYLDEFVGSYATHDGHPIDVVFEEGVMIARRKRDFIFDLVPIDTDKFHVRTSLGMTVEFVRENDIPKYVHIRMGLEKTTGVRY